MSYKQAIVVITVMLLVIFALIFDIVIDQIEMKERKERIDKLDQAYWSLSSQTFHVTGKVEFKDAERFNKHGFIFSDTVNNIDILFLSSKSGRFAITQIVKGK